MAVNGSVVVSAALKYQGHAYVYGGFDCSKMVNLTVGHDLKMAIPGYAAGTYDGVAHGPVVSDWAGWSGAPALPSGVPPSAGDIVVFNGPGELGHMGIALGPNQMISALDTEEGTRVTPIIGYGPIGAPLSYHRLTGVAGTTASMAGLTSAGSMAGNAAGELILALLAGAAIPAAMVGVILVGAVLVGLAGAGAITYAAARAAGQ